MEKKQFVVGPEMAGVRIDKVISSMDASWSRSQVQQWFDEDILVNGKLVKPSYTCSLGDSIEIFLQDSIPLDVIPENLHLDIVYEDHDVLVVNKPRGMVVHPSAGHQTGTLVNGLMFHCKDLSGINGVLRPGIVHRIDKDTTGLLVVAKNDYAHESLVEQLMNRTVLRTYRAIVHGVIPHQEGTIDAPIGRDTYDRQSMTVTSNGKKAITHFTVLERFTNFTYVLCKLETGRTHQIRVHFKYIGFPLAGDPKYGPKKTISFPGQVLHAGTLGFVHPKSGKELQFEAPLPDDFQRVLDELRNNVDFTSLQG